MNNKEIVDVKALCGQYTANLPRVYLHNERQGKYVFQRRI